jgi:hypothetical protein
MSTVSCFIMFTIFSATDKITNQFTEGDRLCKSTWSDKITVFLRCVLFAQWHAHILKAGTRGSSMSFYAIIRRVITVRTLN